MGLRRPYGSVETHLGAVISSDVKVIRHFISTLSNVHKVWLVKNLHLTTYVPFIEDDDKFFLKSIIPSRKQNNKY